MAVYYIDTSALVKRYHVELGSDRVDRLFADPASILLTANLTITELTSGLDRKQQEGLVSHCSPTCGRWMRFTWPSSFQ